MRIRFFLFFFSFILIGCVPKIKTIKINDTTDITNELKSLDKTNKKTNLTLQWWESFQDLQLNFIIKKALKEAPSLKSIEQRYAKANTIIESISSKNLPTISSNYNITRERYSANHIFPAPLGGGMFTANHAEIALSYKFDFWDERKSRIKSAIDQAFAQKAFIEESKINLSLSITQLYLSWNYNEKKIELLEKIENILNNEVRIIKLKYNTGLIDKTDVNTKKAQLYKVKYSIYSLKEMIKGQKTSICILSGFLPSFIENMKKPNINDSLDLDLPKDIYINFLSNRADIIIQKYIILSNEQQIHVAKTKFYPNVNLSGLLGFTSFGTSKFINKSSSVPSVGLAIDLPLFDWGRREANLDDKVIEYNSSVYQYNNTVNRAVNEVVGVLKKIKYKSLQLEMHEKELMAVEENEHITNKKFMIGLSNKVPYLDSKMNTLYNHITGCELLQSHLTLQLELIKVLGGGFKEANLQNDKS